MKKSWRYDDQFLAKAGCVILLLCFLALPFVDAFLGPYHEKALNAARSSGLQKPEIKEEHFFSFLCFGPAYDISAQNNNHEPADVLACCNFAICKIHY